MPYSMRRMPYFICRMPCEIWHTAYETLLRRKLEHLRRLTQYSGLAVDDEVVVVAAAEFQLLVVLVDARADRRRLRKVERRAFDASQFAGRDQSRVDRC